MSAARDQGPGGPKADRQPVLQIVFVCLGNICRSPAAEAVFRSLSARAAPGIVCDSAGTADWHTGKPPYGAMISCADARGYDLSGLRARQFQPGDFMRFDLIIAMDGDNRRDIENLRPAGNRTPVRLLLEYAATADTQDLPDPYYSRDFETALDLIEMGSRGLLADLTRGL